MPENTSELSQEPLAPLITGPNETSKNLPTVIGVGASAGGLEAIQILVQGLDPELQATMIIAMHLSPNHHSQLQEILGKSATLKVATAEHGMTLEPGRIIVTPPNVNILIQDLIVHLEPAAKGPYPKPSCDKLFQSLADSLGEKAIAVVLSGTGSDGSVGARAIKQAGGVVVVQEPREAKYDGMPNATIATGCVDLVVPTAELPDCVSSIVSPSIQSPESGSDKSEEDEIRELVSVLKAKTGTDFSYIKQGTLSRRINRRRALHGNESYQDYMVRLKNDAVEADNLGQSILISVTTFFRDPDCWQGARELLRRSIMAKSPDSTFRIWVPACATGEEAYTVAMICLDIMDTLSRPPSLTIFASDLDAAAIEKARSGYYAKGIQGNLPVGFLEKFFSPSGDFYQLKNRVRQSVVFSVQNLITDPPFSRIDFISCRNFLIYLVPQAQQQIFELLHYALVENGALMLGATESVMQSSDLFRQVSDDHRLFARSRIPDEYRTSLRTRLEQPFRPRHRTDVPVSRNRAKSLAESAQFIISSQLSPFWLIVDDHDIVKFISPECRRFIVAPSGPAILRIFDVLAPELNLDIRGLMFRARRAGERMSGGRVFIRIDGEMKTVMPTVVPMTPDYRDYWLLMLDVSQTRQTDSDEGDEDSIEGTEKDLYMRDLESRIDIMKQDMQSMSEELETSNEELQSQSEELQSANEELQSTNEQLLTSNEELHSSNEELQTVNDELRARTEESERQSDHWEAMGSLFDGTVLFFDREFVLRGISGDDAALAAFFSSHPASGRGLLELNWREIDGDIPNKIRKAKTSPEEQRYSIASEQHGSFDVIIKPVVPSHGAQPGNFLGAVVVIRKS